MFHRKVYDQLLQWKRSSNGTSAMLIEGARRVGKSTVSSQFGRQEYAQSLLIDFTTVSPDFKQLFLDTRSDLDSFFLYLSATFAVTFKTRDTLIIFDEVQAFPEARQFIKHLVADGRYDYLETGSLVSLRSSAEKILLPSEEESLLMKPLDFEEFLWALEEHGLAELIGQCFQNSRPLPDELHRKATRLWNEYMLVGGMPAAVAAYAQGRDLAGAQKAKQLVVKLYRDDIEKYGGTEAKRVKAVFDAIPGQLSKREKRLVYTQVDEGSRARDYQLAFSWMKDAATVNLCTAVTDPTLSMELSEDETTVKCYLADTGLLTNMAFANDEVLLQASRQVLRGDADINQGMLAENAVAQQLAARGHELHFYSRYSRQAAERMEIDFLISCPHWNAAGKPRISPLEVKSGKRYTTVSLDKFKAKFGKRVGTQYVLHPGQLRVERERMFLPLYMSAWL
ncbi:hypothetical protein HMPREF0578_0456 [Mobiluncus mulieris 28-1]|uniref:ATPase n=1 Tax=Mobiluncus mulieris TaxID=2052 RepID=A0A8G2HR88_9ACTO|nr:AAA family ATPase [Mobiluncus mulieris]EEZ91418.1 hypothetical protein HMPREF0578_0456 [Mobiluncus mulieris 28-1]MBB5845463.1 putative AAA+ superfamily ATPase [Mobiluncus mulieris]MCV0002627.1 ATP-binding protein [Mobiluncus mulieris]NMW75661.1 ATP-binding protein [Mobiluncus mulieris]PNL44370.1 ATP-binding protein [Mobiluncus mulieris]